MNPSRKALFLAALLPLSAFGQNVALTFDDPKDPATPGQAEIGEKIRATLKVNNLHTAVFVAGMRVDTKSGIEEIARWKLDGHEIGNHTYSHMNLSGGSITLAQFEADAQRNEELLVSNNLHPTRFRFPYLKEGNAPAKRDGFRSWLRDHKYRSGAVSIDASDWYYDQRYAAWKALRPSSEDSKFKKAYLDHIWSRAQYYDSLSTKYLHRSADHVFLLHANELNAKFLSDIIQMFKSKGWHLIDSSVAFNDPLYKEAPNLESTGESILWQIAKVKGDTTLRFPGEDDSYEKPILDSLGL